MRCASIDGGEPINVTDKLSLRARVSPDSSKVAFYFRENATAKWEIAIISAASHEIVQKLDLPSTVSLSTAFNWSADGKSLVFIETKNGL